MKNLEKKAFKISLALATYNGERYIKEQLESLINQTRLIDEFIISDDCSTDDTVKIAEDTLSRAKVNFKIYKSEENLGCYRNFEKALKSCSGDIIFLSDHDDIWFPNKVEKHFKYHIKNPDSYAITTNCIISDSNLNTFGTTKMDNLISVGKSYKSFVMGCCCSFKRDFIDLALPFPEYFSGHDNWLCELADSEDKRFYINETLQFYRQHTKNTSDYFANDPKGLPVFFRLKYFLKRFLSKFYSHESDKAKQFLFRERFLK